MKTIMGGALLASAVLLGAAPAGAAAFGNFYAFGDSLTDCCALGRTTGGGPNWADLLPSQIGASYSPTSQNNLAVSGALSGYANVAPGTDQGFGAPTGFLAQVGRFGAQGVTVAARDIAGVWVGTNDIWSSTAPAGLLPGWAQAPLGAQPSVASLADHVVGNVRAGIQGLVDIGFRNVVLLSPYDLAQSTATELDPGLGTRYSVAVRDGYAGLNIPGVNTYFLDTLGLLQRVQANPAAYGFDHLTGADSCQAGNCIFSDGSHLTSAFHQLIAASLADAINAGQAPPANEAAPADEAPPVAETASAGEAAQAVAVEPVWAGEEMPTGALPLVGESFPIGETLAVAQAFAAPVPEPVSAALVCVGLVGLGFARGGRGRAG